MADDPERFFNALARTEDMLRKENEALERRVADRLAESIATIRELISVQGIARDSTLRDAIGVLQAENARDTVKCSDHRSACMSHLKDIEQSIKDNGSRLYVIERWMNGHDGQVGAASSIRSLMSWQKNYWPKFIVYVLLTFGGLFTFVLQFVEISFK